MNSESKQAEGRDDRQPLIRRPGEALFLGFLCLVSLLIAYEAFSIAGFSSISSPGAVPMLAGAILVVSAFSCGFDGFKKQAAPAGRFLVEITPPLMLVYASLTLGYILVIDFAGFVPSSALFLFLSILYLYRKGPVISLLVSVNALALIYIVFRVVFKVILPEGSLFE